MLEPFTAEITLDVVVEILDATRGTPGRYDDRPERCYPAEGDAVDLAVWLCRDPDRIELTPCLPRDVLEALAEEALERRRQAAEEARLP